MVTNAVCIGYGLREGVCTNAAGTLWTHLWCPSCDQERRDAISASLARITEKMNAGAPRR